MHNNSDTGEDFVAHPGEAIDMDVDRSEVIEAAEATALDLDIALDEAQGHIKDEPNEADPSDEPQQEVPEAREYPLSINMNGVDYDFSTPTEAGMASFNALQYITEKTICAQNDLGVLDAARNYHVNFLMGKLNKVKQ